MIALYSISQTYCHVKQFLCIGTVPPLGLILIIPLLGQTFTIVRGTAADYQDDKGVSQCNVGEAAFCTVYVFLCSYKRGRLYVCSAEPYSPLLQ